MWNGGVSVTGGVPVGSFPTLTVSGVTLSESNTLDGLCINSTLIFNGDLTALAALNGATLTCDTVVDPEDTVTIVVPGRDNLQCLKPEEASGKTQVLKDMWFN